MTATETRLLSHPSLLARHAIISMPKTAWYWLDELVQKRFEYGGFGALMRTFAPEADRPETLSKALKREARLYGEKRMADLYNLANDNNFSSEQADLKRNKSIPATPDLSVRMPSLYRLFHFMPHPTYLTTVWERRNYHQKDDPS